jgi:hypothetical protein
MLASVAFTPVLKSRVSPGARTPELIAYRVGMALVRWSRGHRMTREQHRLQFANVSEQRTREQYAARLIGGARR